MLPFGIRFFHYYSCNSTIDCHLNRKEPIGNSSILVRGLCNEFVRTCICRVCGHEFQHYVQESAFMLKKTFFDKIQECQW